METCQEDQRQVNNSIIAQIDLQCGLIYHFCCYFLYDGGLYERQDSTCNII